MSRLMEVANRYVNGEETMKYETKAFKGKGQAESSGPKGQSNQGRKNGNQNRGQKRKADNGDGFTGAELVAVAGHGKHGGGQKQDH